MVTLHVGEVLAGKTDDLLAVLGMIVALMGLLVGGLMMRGGETGPPSV